MKKATQQKNKKDNLPKGWIETTLWEVAEIFGGYAFKGKHFNTYSDVYVVKIKDIKPPIVDIDNATRLDLSSYLIEKIDKYILTDGDFVIAMTGATIGKVGKIKTEKKVYLNQRVAKVEDREGISYKQFLYYLISGKKFEKFINNISAGSSAQQNVSSSDIGNFPIFLPPLSQQKAIAGVLSSLDNKIELLREQNNTLEKIGQEIFKEWFGRYQNIKFSLAKYILEFKKGIEVGSRNYFENKKDLFDPVMFYRVGDISDNGKLSKVFVDSDLGKDKFFNKKDVLVSFDGTVGRVFVGGEGIYSSGIRNILPKKDFEFIKKSYIYFWAKSKIIQKTIHSYSEGTTIQHAGKSIPYMEIISDKELITELQEKLNPIYEKILLNLDQIQTLSQTRDTLLPKLMNGEIILVN